MKINRLNQLFCATALSSVVFLAVGCSDKKTMTDASASADKPAPAVLPVAPNPASTALAPDAAAPMAVAADEPGAAADGWAAIKDDTFAQRTHFSAGMQTMKSGMDDQIATMTAKHGTMKDSMNGSMMDGAMTEVTAARTNLQSTSDKLDQATADTWTNDKEMVAQAWMRMQSACTKAQSS
jgi:hypothetical protein